MKGTTVPLILSLLAAACGGTLPPAPPAVVEPLVDHGLTLQEEAKLLQLEDRREFDAELAAQWLRHPSASHRARMALALARIGTATFVDANGNGVRDEGELMAGVQLLSGATRDPSVDVRRTVAFALGEIGDPAGIAALFDLASGDEHGGVRAEAIEGLSKMAEEVSLARYERFTGPDEPPGVRVPALRYLFRFEGDEPLAIAIRYLGDPDVNVRRAATYTLSRRSLHQAQTSLIERLGDSDTLIRAYAARALGRVSSPASYRPLLEVVHDIHPWVRIEVLRALAQVVPAHPGEMAGMIRVEDALVLVSATSDPDPGARAAAIETTGIYARRFPSAKERLLQIAAEGETGFREIAAQTLARHFPDDENLLAALLETDLRWTRMLVLREISTAGGAVALRAAHARSSDPSVRATAVATIPDGSIDGEIDLIISSLEDPDPVVRATAVSQLAKSSHPERLLLAREMERRSRDDEENDARLAAIRATTAIDPQQASEVLRGLLGDRDSVVRRIAADALEAMGEPRPQYTPLETGREIGWYFDVAEWARQPQFAVIETVRGPIELLLLTGDAPITAWNFADLASRGYYDDTSFMRVVPNFVIQGGDPRNDMSGGPGYSIRDEINLQKYSRGALGMALSGPDTGGSQFFINHSPQHHLDGGYTIFGRVTGGMTTVVDEIRRGDHVRTIRIVGEGETAVTSEIALPLEVGSMTSERCLEIPEYVERMREYEPDPDVVTMMASMLRPEHHLTVVLGTWCDDSQREVPRLLKLLDVLQRSHGARLETDFIAVDRTKSEPAELIGGLSIESVATIIVFFEEEELGRIVEAPVSLLEDDLLAILARGSS
jgi:cyclophilin family peptidyl-prolyl cis-trans isomerase/HEAT repeat protein